MKLSKLILPLLLCLCCLLACGEKEPAATTVPEAPESLQMTEVTEEEPDIPLTADYGGADFRILTAGNIAYEDFTADETASMPLDIAQYKRKMRVEESYKVKISETKQSGYSSGGGPGFLEISRAVSAGECNYDLALVAGYDVSALAYAGMLYDLKSMPGIALTKSWWDQKANGSLTLCDVLFFTTGDITCSDNDAAFTIMFNKKLLADYNLDSPYDMVYSGEWTLENFKSLCKAVTEDLNNDDVMDENDRYGLLVWVDSNIGMVHAAGQRCCVANGDALKLTLYNESTVRVIEQYLSFALDRRHALQYQSIRSGADFEYELWSGDHGLFWTTYMGIVPKFRASESDFGLLPYPKANAAQESYYSTVAPYNSQFICVPLIQDDAERTGVLTEALAYYGQKIVLPAYYDVSLKGVHARDEESADMLDIIFDNLVFDAGFIYQVGPYNKYLNMMISNGDTNFASVYDSRLQIATEQLKQINSYYAAAAAQWKTEN